MLSEVVCANPHLCPMDKRQRHYNIFLTLTCRPLGPRHIPQRAPARECGATQLLLLGRPAAARSSHAALSIHPSQTTCRYQNGQFTSFLVIVARSQELVFSVTMIETHNAWACTRRATDSALYICTSSCLGQWRVASGFMGPHELDHSSDIGGAAEVLLYKAHPLSL